MLHKILFIYIISTQNQSSTNKDFDTPKFSTRPSSDDCLKFYYNLNKSCEHFQCNFPCVFETFGEKLENSNWTNSIKAIGTLHRTENILKEKFYLIHQLLIIFTLTSATHHRVTRLDLS